MGGDSLVLDDGTYVGVGELATTASFNVSADPGGPFYAARITSRRTGSRAGLQVYMPSTSSGTNSGISAEAITGSQGGAANGIIANAKAYNSDNATGINAFAITNGGTSKALDVQVDNNGTGKSYLLYGHNTSSSSGIRYGLYLLRSDRNYLSGKLSLGIDSTASQLTVRGSSTPYVMRVDQNSAFNGLIEFRRKGAYIGAIYDSSGNVIYSAFTGAHFADVDPSVEPGMLVTLSGGARRLSHASSEPIYATARSSAANQRNVLGVFSSRVAARDDVPAHDLVNAVGNTDVWVVDNGANIAAGDALITSHVPGHAMRDDGSFAIANVFAKAAEDVDWSQVAASKDGFKRKKITVLLDSFVVNHKATRLAAEVAELRRDKAAMQARLADHEARLRRLEQLLSKK